MGGMHDNSFNKLNSPSAFIKRLDVIIQEDRALNTKYNDLIYWLKSLVMYITHGEAGTIKDYNVYLSQGFTTLGVGQNHTLLHALTAIDSLLGQFKTSKIVFINREQSTIPAGLGGLNDIVLSTSNNTLYRFDGTRYINIGKFRKDTLYIKDYDEDFIIYKSIDNDTLIPLSGGGIEIFQTQADADVYLSEKVRPYGTLVFIEEFDEFFFVDNSQDAYKPVVPTTNRAIQIEGNSFTLRKRPGNFDYRNVEIGDIACNGWRDGTTFEPLLIYRGPANPSTFTSWEVIGNTISEIT